MAKQEYTQCELDRLRTLEDACTRALGIRKHPSTFRRWHSDGVIGRDGQRHYLDAEKKGSFLYTSIARVLEFDKAINAAPPRIQIEPPPVVTPSRESVIRRRSNAQRLAALGMT